MVASCSTVLLKAVTKLALNIADVMKMIMIFFNNNFRRYLDTSKLFDNQQLSKEIAIDVLQKVSKIYNRNS